MSLNGVLSRAIQRAPCSVRALARAAGVSHVTLALIVQGKQRATPRVAFKVARALDEWATKCRKEAARVREAANDH
jgi:plasmid maintenance system antidote protein VapI